MKRIVLILIWLVAFTSASAQKNNYTFERLEWINPWLTTSNSSGLGLNESFLSGTSAITQGAIQGDYSFGSLQNVYDPEASFGGNFDIGSYLKLGKSYLKGSFGYGYNHSQNSRFRGWIDPYQSPFMVADSIPGSVSLEQYIMGVKFSRPIGKSVFLGLGADYNVGIMAKHRDLRNKNTLMDFAITPSFMFHSRNFNLGFDFTYNRKNETVEYKQEDTSTEKYLFDISGLWYYHSAGFSSAETSRESIASGYGGSFTIDASFGKVRLFNDFTGRYNTALQKETGYNNLLHGLTKQLIWSDHLSLLIGFKHKIDLKLNLQTMGGSRFLQRQELDPQSNIRVWVTYGDPVNDYYRTIRSEELKYTYRHARSFTEIEWEISVAIKDTYSYHKKKNTFGYPYSQNLSTQEAALSFTRYLPTGRGRVEVNPAIGYRFTTDGNEFISPLVANGPAEEETNNNGGFLGKQLEQEYRYWAAPKLSGSIGINYIHNAISIKGNYSISYVTSGSLQGKNRNAFSIAFGFIF